NGDVKSRKIQLQTKSGKKFFAIARLQSPTDLKGTALLSIIDKKGEDQWLYTPSNQQVRRIVSVKKAGGILGSELSLQDLNSGDIAGAELQMIRSDSKDIVVEAIPKKGTSPYQKVQTHFSPTQFVPLRTEYFQAQKLVKTVEFTDYKKVGDHLWRAQKIIVKNLKNGRGTELVLSQVKVNQDLKEEDFSVSALKD
ncbi:MAG TPA: outer membrane lipoprotein-sorting protein, partial [Pseudobdellovibrionaceae bacterium]